MKKILCVIDPTTRAQPALHRAERVAHATKAELELFICYYDDYLSGQRFYDAPSLSEAREEVLARQTEYLETIAVPARDSGLTVNTAVSWDRPLHDGIVRQVEASQPDIVFKDTHHHSAMQRALFTNTDWNLIRNCPVPLWLVKPRDIRAEPIVLTAIDPAHRNDKPASMDERILNMGSVVTKTLRGQLHSFHSCDPRVALATAASNAYLPVSLPLKEIERNMLEQHGKRFDEVVASFDLAEDCKHLVSGAAHEALPEIARDLGVDVVVMGAIARNRWKRLYIGSTAERTLENLPCDLLIVKPDWVAASINNQTQ